MANTANSNREIYHLEIPDRFGINNIFRKLLFETENAKGEKIFALRPPETLLEYPDVEDMTSQQIINEVNILSSKILDVDTYHHANQGIRLGELLAWVQEEYASEEANQIFRQMTLPEYLLKEKDLFFLIFKDTFKSLTAFKRENGDIPRLCKNGEPKHDQAIEKRRHAINVKNRAITASTLAHAFHIADTNARLILELPLMQFFFGDLYDMHQETHFDYEPGSIAQLFQSSVFSPEKTQQYLLDIFHVLKGGRILENIMRNVLFQTQTIKTITETVRWSSYLVDHSYHLLRAIVGNILKDNHIDLHPELYGYRQRELWNRAWDFYSLIGLGQSDLPDFTVSDETIRMILGAHSSYNYFASQDASKT